MTSYQYIVISNRNTCKITILIESASKYHDGIESGDKHIVPALHSLILSLRAVYIYSTGFYSSGEFTECNLNAWPRNEN